MTRTANTTFSFFFFNDTATTEIYTLSLHDALPIYPNRWPGESLHARMRVPSKHDPSRRSAACRVSGARRSTRDRKSTRLNSSHSQISYAVFCLKEKKDSRS